MLTPSLLSRPEAFSELLYEKMKRINAAVEEMELYEFRYALANLYPEDGGWASVKLDPMAEVEKLIDNSTLYNSIQLRPRVGDRIILDGKIARLTNALLVGLAVDEYPEEWVRAHFYFDLRGFYFLTRTVYFTPPVVAHLGSRPIMTFEQKQRRFERCQDIGYRQFRKANAEVDQAFFEIVRRLIAARGTPVLIAIAGPTAAGKTEIVTRLCALLGQAGKSVTSIEMDNFLTDRDQREEAGIHSLGQAAIHFELFRQSLEDICQGRKIAIPRYDFVYATSSHDLDGNLKAGCTPIEIEPAEIIMIEGNFPFLLEQVAPLIGIKVVYLTDDAVRLKRKWKRDIDYRKKYEPTYFRNRFFKDQFLMAEKCYRPQMERCDLVVDTTGAAIWTTPAIAQLLG